MSNSDSWMGNVMLYAVIYLAVLFIVFLILREFWCWYFKINQIVSLLRDIRDAGGVMPLQAAGNAPIDVTGGVATPLAAAPPNAYGEWRCAKCHGANEPRDMTCRYCNASRQAATPNVVVPAPLAPASGASFCAECGGRLSPNHMFCAVCGSKVSA